MLRVCLKSLLDRAASRVRSRLAGEQAHLAEDVAHAHLGQGLTVVTDHRHPPLEDDVQVGARVALLEHDLVGRVFPQLQLAGEIAQAVLVQRLEDVEPAQGIVEPVEMAHARALLGSGQKLHLQGGEALVALELETDQAGAAAALELDLLHPVLGEPLEALALGQGLHQFAHHHQADRLGLGHAQPHPLHLELLAHVVDRAGPLLGDHEDGVTKLLGRHGGGRQSERPMSR